MKIPIVLTLDKNYIDQVGAVITSLLYNAKKDTFYEVYIIHNNIREKLEEKINSIKSINLNNENFNHANFTYIDLSHNNEIKKLQPHPHLNTTKAWAYRLTIGELEELKEWEKVIYLDSDIIIESDLEDLYKIDLEGNALAAFVEYNLILINSFYNVFFKNLLDYWENVLKVASENLKYYFNAGILLINTKYWRDNNFYEKAIYYINKYLTEKDYKNHNYQFLMDQDALNYLCLKDEVKIKNLDISWNFITGWFVEKQLKFKNPKYYKLAGIKDVNIKVKIIHYAGKKPWCSDEELPYKENYNKYRELSGWSKKISLLDKNINLKKLVSKIVINIKEFLKNLIIFKPKITLIFIMLLIISNLFLIVKLLT